MCHQALVTKQVSSMKVNADKYIQFSLYLPKYMCFNLCCRYLNYTLYPDEIRKQDATSTIISIASNVVGQPLAWDFIRANWKYIFNQ